jgi:hypothetical protein
LTIFLAGWSAMNPERFNHRLYAKKDCLQI